MACATKRGNAGLKPGATHCSRRGSREWRVPNKTEERFLLARTARRGSGLATQAGRLAGAKREEKAGLLHSK